jgi:hypothetical protein
LADQVQSDDSKTARQDGFIASDLNAVDSFAAVICFL